MTAFGLVWFTKFAEYQMFVTAGSTCHKCVKQMCKSIINKDREYKNNVPRCPHIDMRYGLMQVGQASDPHEPLLG